MAFIYLPSVLVRPYKIFGIPLFVVESVGTDYDTYRVYQIQHGWFNSPVLAGIYAEQLKQGGAE
jgi:hypothetical protein